MAIDGRAGAIGAAANDLQGPTREKRDTVPPRSLCRSRIRPAFSAGKPSGVRGPNRRRIRGACALRPARVFSSAPTWISRCFHFEPDWGLDGSRGLIENLRYSFPPIGLLLNLRASVRFRGRTPLARARKFQADLHGLVRINGCGAEKFEFRTGLHPNKSGSLACQNQGEYIIFKLRRSVRKSVCARRSRRGWKK